MKEEFKKAETGIVRKSLSFSGRVQGVGFRYRAKHAADLLGLTGWVRNEGDGTVSMEVQGPESEIDHMIQIINKGTWVFIENIRAHSLPVEEGEYSFRYRD